MVSNRKLGAEIDIYLRRKVYVMYSVHISLYLIFFIIFILLLRYGSFYVFSLMFLWSIASLLIYYFVVISKKKEIFKKYNLMSTDEMKIEYCKYKLEEAQEWHIRDMIFHIDDL